jgi:TonB family protein
VTVPVARSRIAGADPRDVSRTLQEIAIDARPVASGAFVLAGLPNAGSPLSDGARGTGRGSGFGEGEGSGIGSGRGSGVGPGTGGGMGGGAFRPGGHVSAPVVVTQVRPTYTEHALRTKIQGSVVLELIVRRNGLPDQIRIVRSLDPGGLDEEAMVAVRQWRFEPGRLDAVPVDVLVTIMLDFRIH